MTIGTTHLDARIRALHADGLTDSKIGAALGTSPMQVRRARERLNLAGNARQYQRAADDASALRIKARTDATDVSSLTARIQTLEQLLAAAQVDRAQYDVVWSDINKWEIGAKHPTTGAILIEPLWQVKARIKPKTPHSAETLFRAVLVDVRAATARRARRAPLVLTRDTEPHLFEPNLFDLHLGKLAWGEETHSHYDSKIAADGARTALADLIAQVKGRKIERVVFPIGNDFFQVDNRDGTTTAGTWQDRDSRYHKMFRLGRELASEMIDQLLSLAPVKVIGVPGNHDSLAAWHLVELLEAEFARERRFSADNSAAPRKYERYGAVLLGYTHGDKEPIDKLPNIMAVEAREHWAATRHREWHIGHTHKSARTDARAVDSFNGVRVRVIPALSGTDAWHASKGYVGEPRAAEAFLWHREKGLRTHCFTVLPPTVPAAIPVRRTPRLTAA